MQDDGALERVRRFGVRGAQAADLLALMLSPDSAGVEDQNPRAHAVLRRLGMRRLADLSPADLAPAGETEAYDTVRILAAFELGRKAALAGKGQVTMVNGPEDAERLFLHLRDESQEHFCAAFLNAKNGVLSVRTIHLGTASASVVGAREVFREAVREGATAVIVAHNHPSGDPNPSPEDVMVTRKLIEVGNILDIDLLDHLIIGHHRCVSLKREGLI